MLEYLRSYDGNIIGIDGRPGDVNLKERGYYAGINAGKIFSFNPEVKTLTGLRSQIGIGFMQHKIRIQDNFNNIPALDKAYLHGYDRLTNGPAIQLGLGYQYQNARNNFHFRIMSNLIAAQTKSRRDLDYATGEYLSGKRLDLLYGLSISYIVTISRVKTDEYIYY